MTAFDDILTAEQEAEQSITTAKNEVSEAIAAAKVERKAKIDAEIAKLDESEKKTLESHASHLSQMAQKIQKEVDTKVAAVEAKFETHEAELKTTLKNKFG